MTMPVETLSTFEQNAVTCLKAGEVDFVDRAPRSRGSAAIVAVVASAANVKIPITAVRLPREFHVGHSIILVVFELNSVGAGCKLRRDVVSCKCLTGRPAIEDLLTVHKQTCSVVSTDRKAVTARGRELKIAL